jgi:hypothetical protein
MTRSEGPAPSTIVLCAVYGCDGEPEALQSLYKVSLESFRVEAIEVVLTKLLVHAVVGPEVVADDQQTVWHSDNGAFTSPTRSQSLEQENRRNRVQVRVLAACEVRERQDTTPENQSHSFDDTEVTLRCGSESLQSGLVGGTIVS